MNIAQSLYNPLVAWCTTHSCAVPMSMPISVVARSPELRVMVLQSAATSSYIQMIMVLTSACRTQASWCCICAISTCQKLTSTAPAKSWLSCSSCSLTRASTTTSWSLWVRHLACTYSERQHVSGTRFGIHILEALQACFRVGSCMHTQEARLLSACLFNQKSWVIGISAMVTPSQKSHKCWLPGLERIQVVGSINPATTVGRQPLAPRFAALMHVAFMCYPKPDHLQAILSTMLAATLSKACHTVARPPVAYLCVMHVSHQTQALLTPKSASKFSLPSSLF